MYNFLTIRTAVLQAPPEHATLSLRALLEPEQRQRLRGSVHLQPFLADMRAEAERAAASPLLPLSFSAFHLFESTGDRTAYQTPYFDRRRRLLGLVLTSVIDETDTYLAATEDLIWELCNEYSWAVPAHLPLGIDAVRAYRVPPEQVVDLFAAHTAHALAETLVLLGDRLDPWLQYRIRMEIERRIFRPLFHDPVHFWWESASLNWAAVCAGCVGMAALLLEDDRERLAGMIDRVVRTLDVFVAGFGDDGGCAEGIGYWVYGFGFYVYFAEMLRGFTAGALDLLQGDKMQRIMAFPTAISSGNGSYINFSDASSHARVRPGLGSRLSTRFGQPIPELSAPAFHSDHCYRWGFIVTDLLWTDPAALHTPVADGTSYLSDLAWVADRRTLAGTMVTFGAKGGHNAELHNHNDLGHFILHIGGENLLADLGAGVYTRDYFGPRRYDLLHPGSQGHSVPVIDHQMQRAGRAHAAHVIRYEQHAGTLHFELDLTRAYAVDKLQSFVRHFAWTIDSAAPSARLDLTDTFDFTVAPTALEECFVSLHQPTVEPGRVTWHGARGSVTLQFAADQFHAVVDALTTEEDGGEVTTVYRLRLQGRNVRRHETYQFTLLCHVAV